MDDAKKIDLLLIRRDTLLAQLDRAEKFIENYIIERDSLEVPIRLQNIDVLWNNLEAVQIELEALQTTGEGKVVNLNCRESFEPRLFRIKGNLTSMLPPPISMSRSPDHSINCPPSTLQGLRLPTISLPEFNGDYNQWLSFHDTFLALIHNNRDLPSVQKFHYLRASLKEEAYQLIESIHISSDNYEIAWQSLISRYSNEYLLKKRHLQALLDIPRMGKETAASLHTTVDEFERHVKILAQMKEPVDSWSTILEHLLCTRLHDETLKLWEDHAANVADQSFNCLLGFLHKRVRVLESISVNHNTHPQPTAANSTDNSHRRAQPFRFSTHSTTAEARYSKCYACEGTHPLIHCPTFEALGLQERIQIVSSKGLCFNCFRHDHLARNCSSAYRCRLCQRLHHTMLHPETNPNVQVSQRQPHSNRPNASVHFTQAEATGPLFEQESLHTMMNISNSPPRKLMSSNVNTEACCMLMPTVILKIVDAFGKEHFARALLDSASQPNLISDQLAQLLRLPRIRTDVIIHGIGPKAQRTTESVSTEIRSRNNSFIRTVNFLVLKKLTVQLPAHTINTEGWKIPRNITFADPTFDLAGKIDMIIGLEHFFHCFNSAQRISLSENLPQLVDSVFGWLVTGGKHTDETNSTSCTVVAISLVSLQDKLEKFWKLEELPERMDWSFDECQCEAHFKSTVNRTKTGRYVVRYPKKSSFDDLMGETKTAALRRFQLLEQKLEKNPKLKNEYHAFMEEYLRLGHMKEVNETRSPGRVCYLPHHPVLKESSTTTKTRVVFDGSTKSSSGHSLNDGLLVGPTIQQDLITQVIRFRTFPIALIADIAKMYRQILVHPDDTRMQRILWRFSHTDPIRTYELQTVTYGLAPSAFLATRTLQQLAEDEGHTYPRGKNALLKWFYVDDCIGGAESIEDAIELRDELDKLLSKGGFPLRKYTSNKMEVLKDLKSDQIGTQSNFEFSPEETIKTLGITWEPEPDTFRFDYNTTSPEKITKRAILSTIAQLFDPLGLISPVVVRAKILMQDLWLDSSGWDDQVPPSIEKRWENFKIQLPQLSKYRIPRYALLPHSTVELHTFVDASEAAYGACTYARSTDAAGNVRIELLAAKSRVAPLKKVSLPRLELCAAVKGAELYSRIMQSLEFNPSASYFWTDSTVTLQWLKSPPSTWKTFIANRVSEIQNTTHNANWNHVAGSQNPADMVSRGVSVNNFISNQLWKKGPSWLAEPRTSWPISETCPSNVAECERRDMIVAVIRTEAPDPLFTTYPVLKTLIRTTAYCIRFFKILQANFHKRVAPDISKRPSLEEMQHAKLALIRWAQREAFGREIGVLKKGSQLPKASQIKALNPFIDSEGTIRVGGRPRHSEQSYEFKHPILLPNFHPLSKLIAQFYHYKLIHGGGQVMLAVIHEKYWPINGRRLVRNIVRNCFHCSRANPVPAQQQTGQLPFHRTAPSRPFSIAGVDYAGPLYLKPVHKRAAPQKAYVCLFVCFSTKAVHIELVSDLTTPAFLSALRRFVGRRGPPAHIYSDNGKNFVGAKNELHQIYTMLHSSAESGQIDEFCLQKEIEWHLNPPRAPHFGGLWEAAVKIAKRHLYRQLGASRLSFEDMYSILVEIEAAMNSRPLTPLTEDPNDLTALTPAHFLIGTTMNSVPEVDVSQLPISRLDHYQRMQKLYQSFWYRWRTEYLQELQRDTKVIQPNNEIKPGRLVVIVDDFLPPVKWPLARIVDIKPGVDRLSRVVTLRTAKGYITRPITKICLLPHTENLRRDNSTSNESDNQLIQFQRN